MSYDDGIYQDIRLSEIFNKNGLKATFFVNGGCFLPEDAVRTSPSGKLKLSEAQDWMQWKFTCRHGNPRLMELAEKFIAAPTVNRPCKLFYVFIGV